MKVIMKNVYYCDHCKAKRLTKYSMVLHEGKCLFNPNRECRTPYCPGGHVNQEHIDFIKDNATQGGDPHDDSYGIDLDDIEKLRNEQLDGCPICTLSALCQTRIQFKKENQSFFWVYDFKPIHDKLYAEWQAENMDGYY